MRSRTRPLDQIEPDSRAEWRRWLSQHHAASTGIWLISHTKRSGRQRISVEEAVSEALCFGWIDSRLRRLDRETSALLFTPRRARGTWSRSNRRRVESLIASGLMTQAGLQAVEAAQRDGSWSMLDSVDALEIPGDFAQALAADPRARRNFDAFSASARKMALWWILSAKRPGTRAKRIAATVRRAAQNLTVSARDAAVVIVRTEQPGDAASVRDVNDAAFGRPIEGSLVASLRKAYPEALSLVAEAAGVIVGHILFSPVTIDARSEVGMALATLAVLPDRQRQGIGSALVEAGLRLLQERECPFVIVIGHPAFYPRFGFHPATELGLRCQWPAVPNEAFMALELRSGTLQGVTGLVRYPREFDAAV